MSLAARLLTAPSATPPLKLWAALVAFAVAGSCLFGASLSLVLPAWDMVRTAGWFAISAGLAWCVFIPSLHFWFGVPWVRAVQVALVTMAGGEVILCSGALGNVLLAATHATAHAGAINAVTVAISNVAMCLLLACQLRRDGVRVRQTVAAWMLILNGSGVLFFALLFRLLHASS